MTKDGRMKGGLGTANAELVMNYDAEDDTTAWYLYRTKKGGYFLRTEKLQIRKKGKWIDNPMDGSAKGLPRNSFRWLETDKPLTENEAIDWYLETVAPERLAKAIGKQIGKLVSCDLGDLAKPLAAYCKRIGMSPEKVCQRALDEALRPRQGIQEAIELLQSAITRWSGSDFDADIGAGTLYISHGAVTLTNPSCSIVAQSPGSIARKLQPSPADRSAKALVLGQPTE